MNQISTFKSQKVLSLVIRAEEFVIKLIKRSLQSPENPFVGINFFERIRQTIGKLRQKRSSCKLFN